MILLFFISQPIFLLFSKLVENYIVLLKKKKRIYILLDSTANGVLIMKNLPSSSHSHSSDSDKGDCKIFDFIMYLLMYNKISVSMSFIDLLCTFLLSINFFKIMETPFVIYPF